MSAINPFGGVRRAGTELRSCHGARKPDRDRHELPGEPDDQQAATLKRQLTASSSRCLCVPNGNPAPGPKFAYKLCWFERFIAHASELLALDVPVLLAGDYYVMPADLDVYAPERWLDDAAIR